MVYYDEVAIWGLALAQLDVNRGALDHAHRVRIKEAVEWVIDDLSDHDDAASPAIEEGLTEMAAPPSVLLPEELAPSWREKGVLCVAGRGSLDEAAAMLAQLLEKRGIGARVVPSEAVSVTNLFRLDVTGVQMACLSYLEPGSFNNARYLVRRLRRRLPQAKIVDGFWTLTAQEAQERDALGATRADCVVTSLRQAVQQVVNTAKDAASADLVGEIRAPAVAPLAAANGDTLVERQANSERVTVALPSLWTVYQVRSTAPERSGRAISVFGEVTGERREGGAPFGRMKML